MSDHLLDFPGGEEQCRDTLQTQAAFNEQCDTARHIEGPLDNGPPVVCGRRPIRLAHRVGRPTCPQASSVDIRPQPIIAGSPARGFVAGLAPGRRVPWPPARMTDSNTATRPPLGPPDGYSPTPEDSASTGIIGWSLSDRREGVLI
jgi:hypothetical protein